jgi:hypothetical protein
MFEDQPMAWRFSASRISPHLGQKSLAPANIRVTAAALEIRCFEGRKLAHAIEVGNGQFAAQVGYHAFS